MPDPRESRDSRPPLGLVGMWRPIILPRHGDGSHLVFARLIAELGFSAEVHVAMGWNKYPHETKQSLPHTLP